MNETYDCLDGFCGALDCVRCHPECVDEPDPDEWMGPYDDGMDGYEREWWGSFSYYNSPDGR